MFSCCLCSAVQDLLAMTVTMTAAAAAAACPVSPPTLPSRLSQHDNGIAMPPKLGALGVGA